MISRARSAVMTLAKPDLARARRWDLGPERTRQETARPRCTRSTDAWTLFRQDRNSRFHPNDDLSPSATVDRMLAEIDADAICIFCG